MAEERPVKQFPDITDKLAAPKKLSLFERQKAEAEAKRKREEAETAAVYEDFVKSFDDGRDTMPTAGSGMRGNGRLNDDTSAGIGGGRHFIPKGPRAMSGPGSMGPAPPSLGRKRALDGSQIDRSEKETGRLGLEEVSNEPLDTATAFRAAEEDDVAETKTAERAAPKPTLHLSSLPPGTSQAVIRSMLPPGLAIDSVRPVPPSGPGSTERRSMSAVVTLAKETSGTDIDTAVSQLQNRYMGWGFYLSISRHLSSSTMAHTPNILGKASSNQPFGAKAAPTNNTSSMSRAPPPDSMRGGRSFAPPESYEQNQRFGAAPAVQVAVQPPSDIKQLKLIHKTLEALMENGPEFEALLMSRPEVQRNEKWGWLWDSRSPGGVYYRWRLWETLTGSEERRDSKGKLLPPMPEQVFDGSAPWLGPERDLPFELVSDFDHFIDHDEYDSDVEEMSDDEARDHRRRHLPDNGMAAGDEDKIYLNPLQKAKLTHLLARLPTTTGRLRKGDIARVAGFAISHAGEGADEVVNMIVSNIDRPFAKSGANTDLPKLQDSSEDDADPEDADKKRSENDDPASIRLIALYVVSDILSSSSTCGVRHAWRYRQLFESAFKSRRTFEKLGRLDKDNSWGRLRAEKWKRSVNALLDIWEEWSAFSQASQEHFRNVFVNPPLTEEEQREEDERVAREEEKKQQLKKSSKWKSVDPSVREDGVPAAESSGKAVAESPKEEAVVLQQPESSAEAPIPQDRMEMLKAAANNAVTESEPLSQPTKDEPPKPAEPKQPIRRARPKAADMFGSDSE